MKIALLSLVCASMPVSFTSCKDYDSDIDGLRKDFAEMKTALDAIKTQVSQGGVIQSVAPSADGKGIVITVLKDGSTQSYTITNGKDGQNGKDADVWTIDAEGYWCCNGTRTEYKAVGTDGKDGAPGTPGAPGDYYKPNGKGYFDLYHFNTATGKWEVTENAVPYATDGDHITAVVTANDVFLYGVGGVEGAIVLAKTGALRSLVFKPDFYYQGIEAMDAATFKFEALKVGTVNADDKTGANDAPTANGEVQMTPALVANYHLNPTSANIDNIFSLDFIAEDLQYARATAGITAKVFDKSAKDGILTVKANLQGDIKDINEDGLVTVLALQARLNEKAAAADTVITSDYAAVKASYYTDIDLAVPANAPTMLATPTSVKFGANHWYTSAQEAINNEPTIALVWDNSEGLDIAKYIQADYTNAKGVHQAFAKPVNEYGFKYEYALVGYVDGANQTSQSAHAALNPNDPSWIRAQMPKDGKAQPWGYEQKKATLGRMPLVRVTLVDTVSANRPVAAVAYVKLLIDEKGSLPPSENLIGVNFGFDKNYTVSCATAETVFPLTWSEIEESILAHPSVNMSKETFEANYSLRMADAAQGIAQQVLVGANNAINNATGSDVHGVVTKLPDPTLPQGTEVVKWTISANDVYNWFTGTTKPKDMSVVVVYDGKPGTSFAKSHITITLTWTPKELHVTPTVSVDDASKIAELWFSFNSATSASNGGLKQENHLNVAVPNNNLTPAACTFVNNLLYPFVGNKVGMTGLESFYTDYVDTKASFAFVPVTNAPTKVQGVSGATYDLVADGNSLKAKLGLVSETIAVINNSVEPATVTYQDGTFAKDVLNFAGAQDLGYGKTLSATIAISANNTKCGKPLTVNNNTYNVRFLRPITVNVSKPAHLKDAIDNGSTLEVATCLSFIDWRNIAFTADNKYLDYYGVTGVYVGEFKNGQLVVANPNDITGAVYTNLNGANFTKTLKEMIPDIELSYTQAATISLTNVGVLNYKNAGNVLGFEFQIRVPFIVEYKWGYVVVPMDITIDPTIGQ
ncbi:MAG: hypothetical protein Q4C34_06670 [Bacteroidales bacterium]|nr:hypothetical protein [Bacteroidales bacterium]